MKKEVKSLLLIFSFILVLSLSFASAGFFSDLWGKITGNVVNVGSDGWTEWLNKDGPGGVGDYVVYASFGNQETGFVESSYEFEVTRA